MLPAFPVCVHPTAPSSTGLSPSLSLPSSNYTKSIQGSLILCGKHPFLSSSKLFLLSIQVKFPPPSFQSLSLTWANSKHKRWEWMLLSIQTSPAPLHPTTTTKKTICHLSGKLYGRTSQDGVGFPKSEERSMEQEEGKKAGQQRTFIGCYSKCGRKSSCWTIALNMQTSKHNTEPTGPVSWRCMKYVFQRRALHCLHMAHPSRSSCSKLSLPLSFYEYVGAQSLCLSVVSDSFATPWTVAHQAPLSMGFPRQKYWSGLPFPPPVDLPDPGIKLKSPASPALHADCLSLNHICNSLNDRWLVDITTVIVQFWLTSLLTMQEKNQIYRHCAIQSLHSIYAYAFWFFPFELLTVSAEFLNPSKTESLTCVPFHNCVREIILLFLNISLLLG